ncbi:MAG: c-type cytochrome biogenesis protein CcsB [Firmicutes bacterium]|nr:c-type cytochrome biogenesis protein CcsB [Bacillota bacterium]
MTGIETVFFWITVILLAIASSLFAGGISFRRTRPIGVAYWLTVAAAAALTIAIISRTLAVGHLPLTSKYEGSLTTPWLMILIYVWLQFKIKNLRPFGVAIAPIALIILGAGVMSGPKIGPLTPQLRSIWLYAHATFSQLTVVSMLVAFGLAVLYLFKERGLRAGYGAGTSGLNKLPAPEVLDDLSFRFIIFGYITSTIMIITGSIWANHLWGSYWNWDPIETWSLISWLIYGIYLHTRFSYGWKGRRASWFAIIATISIIINFWGVAYLTQTFHILSRLS